MEKLINTKLKNYKLKFAEEKDVPVILGFIKELASYENLTHEVIATEELLKRFLFERRMAEVIIGEYEGKPVGFALFFHNFSTFLGRPGIYLEDLYVMPNMRGKGFGKTLLTFLARLAVERDCGRLEWACLDWNQPSIRFYKQLGAIPKDEWTVYRVSGDTMTNLAEDFGK
jgi:GNAT superfamily N-acetyltransferase